MLNFETKSAQPAAKEVNVIGKPHPMVDPKLAIQLQQALHQMTKHLEALETRLQSNGTDHIAHNRNPTRNHRSNDHAKYTPITDHDLRYCWECGELGQFQCDCPQLNYHEPARSVGQLAKEIIYIHRPTQTTTRINAIFYADGHTGKVPTKILLDTGATVSVARHEFLPEVYRQRLIESPGAVSANGMPLDVVGKAKIAVSLGSFSTEEEFMVICNLTVDCLLGADFLKEHGAVMDC